MALTLAESAKLSTDMVNRGVIETIIEESPVMGLLPFETVEGNSYKYNQENTLGGASFFAVGGCSGFSLLVRCVFCPTRRGQHHRYQNCETQFLHVDSSTCFCSSTFSANLGQTLLPGESFA